MATEICNAVNELNFPNEFKNDYAVCRNTFMSTLEAYTDFECQSVLRQKAAADHKRKTIPVDASVLTSFHKMVEHMKTGGGVGFMIDPGDVANVCNDTLTTTPVPDDDLDDDDVNVVVVVNGEEEEE
jgi:hypothetical protein